MLGSHHLFIVYICLVSVLTGCGSDFDGSEDQNGENLVTPFNFNSLCNESLNHYFEPQIAPNSYKLKFEVNKEAPKSYEISLQTESFKQAKHSINEVENFDLEVQGGEKIILKVREVLRSGTLTKCEKELLVPRDLVVESQADFNRFKSPSYELITDGRIFLLNEMPIYIKNHQVRIEANEIISKNTRFKSFKDAAIDGNIGANAQSFQIIAKKLSGEINIDLRGQKGATGRQGDQGPEGTKGPTGDSWNHAWFKLGETPVCYIKTVHNKSVESRPKIHPSNHPLKGKKGLTGHPGKPGKKGLPGGNGGRLVLDIEDFNFSQIKYSLGGGFGGDGGPGGPGGEGGEGGDPGTLTGWGSSECKSIGHLVSCCPRPSNGETGDEGPPGPQGPEGESGKPGELILNGVRINE